MNTNTNTNIEQIIRKKVRQNCYNVQLKYKYKKTNTEIQFEQIVEGNQTELL